MASPRQPATSTSAVPTAPRVDTQTHVLDTVHGRILCIADIRGRISALNDLARDHQAVAIIHTGDFGFFENSSLDRINDRTLKHLTTYSPLIPGPQRTHLTKMETPTAVLRQTVSVSMLSEFPLLVAGQLQLSVPVYTTWGACEDVAVLEKIRLGTYTITNLHVLDEAVTRCIDIGGIKLRLFALGGALVPHKMFDNGDGNATIAGGQGTMWTTALQIGQLVDTAQRVFDPTETRLLISHASPGREGILAQLAVVLKADLTMSAGLHFRYATSYNEFSVQSDFDSFRQKLIAGKEQFDKVWDSVKTQVDAVIDENQRVLLDKALSVVNKIPPSLASGGGEEPSWKNCWNWNLTDAAYGVLVLDIKEGRVSAELKSQGFNYAYRRVAPTPSSATSPLPAQTPNVPKPITPAPQQANAIPPPPREEVEAAPSTPVDGKPERKKKDKKDKNKSVSSPAPGSPAPVPPKAASPIPTATASVPAAIPEDLIKSPRTESSGIRTPQRTKPARNPWTIFMRFSGVSPTETEIREFFQDAKDGITKITLPTGKFASQRSKAIAYVEFGDEEAMRKGLEGHREKLGEVIPEVKQATEKGERDVTPGAQGAGAGGERGGHRGRGGVGAGRGGRGGGFAQRQLAAAGMSKPPTPA